MMKTKTFLTIMIAILCLSTVPGAAQTVVKTSDQLQKQNQNIKVVVKADPKKMGQEMTIVVDSAIQQQGNNSKEQNISVTVVSTDDGTGKGNAFSYTIGDTLHNGEAQKVVRSVNGKHMIVMQRDDDEKLNLPTSPHRAKGYRLASQSHFDPFAFDPKDTSIVSYTKKDVGKGLEKITIVRRKATSSK